MSSTTAQLLRRATTSTFEDLAFLVLDDECTEAQAQAPLDAAVAVEFHGPVRGRFVLRVSSSLLPVIAANMLGEEQARHVPLQRDALGEVANVVCGNLLPLVAGAEAVFRLSAPEWLSDDTVSRPGDEPEASLACGVEDGRVEARLFVFGGEPLHALADGSAHVAGLAS